MKKFVNDKISDIVDERQFGGVAGTCITDALAEMLHEWYKATDDRKTFVRVLLVDYTKAFDPINYDILINKVTRSDWKRLRKGTPQGAVMGPFAYNAHTNDLILVLAGMSH